MERGFAVFKVKEGWMGLVGNEKGIERIFLPVPEKEEIKISIFSEFPECKEKGSDILAQAKKELMEYFSGDRTRFDFPLDLSSATPFQRKVYQVLSGVPFGEVRTYRWLAEKIGNPRALRAVGGANGKNRWPLAIPCHRIVGSDGRLTGFSAPGGLALKSNLLKQELIPVERDRVPVS